MHVCVYIYKHTHTHTHIYIYIYVNIYRVIKKSLCTWWLQCKNVQKYFNQFQSLTMMIWRWPSQNTFGMWTVLYWIQPSRTEFGVSINVWRLAGDTLNVTCNFLYCNHQVHRDFLVTLCNICIYLRKLLLLNEITLIYALSGIGRVWIITRRLSQIYIYIYILQKQCLFLQYRATCFDLEGHHQAIVIQNIKGITY
jgi:hypothetical protein